MSNQGEQQTESQLLDIMKKNLEEGQEEDNSNKFPPNFQPINSENIKNKNKQENDPNYEDFLNAGTEKLISGLNKLNLGNNSSNPTISPKKPESMNYFQNPMMNMNMSNQNNQKDLAFNYYFGSGLKNDSIKKNVENPGQDVSSQFLEHLRFNPNNNDINEQQLKNFFNNKQNDENNLNEEEKIENDMYKMNSNNNMILNQQGKIILNMNFQNKNNFGLNENLLKQNQNQNNLNNINNLNNLNLNNQMMQKNNNINNMNLGANMQFNKMDPRIRNMIQQNMMMNNMMMGNNNNMQMNQNQNQLLMNNQNNMQINQKS
jgi:hypothetical protein